jgi:hypothetical protein
MQGKAKLDKARSCYIMQLEGRQGKALLGKASRG